MGFKELYEAKQVGTLYHNTSLQNLMSILKDNVIKSHIYSDYTKVSGRTLTRTLKGTSFTRDKNAELTDIALVNLQTKIVVDGDSLSNTYKIRPRDEFYDTTIAMGKRSESEEFVKGDIINAIKYIKQIYLREDEIADAMLEKNPITYISTYLAFELSKLDKDFYENPLYKESIQKMKDTNKAIQKDGISMFLNILAKAITKKYNIKVSLK